MSLDLGVSWDTLMYYSFNRFPLLHDDIECTCDIKRYFVFVFEMAQSYTAGHAMTIVGTINLNHAKIGLCHYQPKRRFCPLVDP